MLRPKISVYLLAPMVLAVAALSACSSPHASEENLVRQFFRASGLRDTQTLSNFATVSFEPKTEGTVADFEITGVSAERANEPVRVMSLTRRDGGDSANKAFNERRRRIRTPTPRHRSRVESREIGRKVSGPTRRFRRSGRNGAMRAVPKRRKCRLQERRSQTPVRSPS